MATLADVLALPPDWDGYGSPAPTKEAGETAGKVLDNDGWKQISSWTDSFEVDPKRPGVEVTITEVRDEP